MSPPSEGGVRSLTLASWSVHPRGSRDGSGNCLAATLVDILASVWPSSPNPRQLLEEFGESVSKKKIVFSYFEHLHTHTHTHSSMCFYSFLLSCLPLRAVMWLSLSVMGMVFQSVAEISKPHPGRGWSCVRSPPASWLYPHNVTVFPQPHGERHKCEGPSLPAPWGFPLTWVTCVIYALGTLPCRSSG